MKACWIQLKIVLRITAAAYIYYIKVHFKLDVFMEASNMNPDQTAPRSSCSPEQSDPGPFCLQCRLCRRAERQKVMTGDKRVKINIRSW